MILKPLKKCRTTITLYVTVHTFDNSALKKSSTYNNPKNNAQQFLVQWCYCNIALMCQSICVGKYLFQCGFVLVFVEWNISLYWILAINWYW